MNSKRKIWGLFLGIFFVSSLFMIACSDDDSPADHDVFVGTYRGAISYSNGTENTTTNDGTVRVVKVGNNYNFLFSNGIPDLTGVEFEKDGETLINIGWTETELIRVTASKLRILYTKDGRTWTADCER